MMAGQARARASVRGMGIALPALWIAAAMAAPARAQDVPFEQVNVEKYLTNPHCKGLGDIDGDGYPDLVAGGTRTGALLWYRYVNRTTWTRYVIATGNYTTSMDLADMDGDGDLDVVIPTGNNIGDHLWWFENPRPGGDPRTAAWTKHDIGAVSAHDVVAGDVTGDGRPDVVVQYGPVSLFVQNSADSWTKVTVLGTADEGTALGDIDRDGDLDIVVGGRWLENPRPAQAVTAAWAVRTYDGSVAPNSTKWACGVADLNKDGRPDIILAPGDYTYDGTLRVYLAPADPRAGTWTRANALTGSGELHGLQAADFDGDGDLDIAAAEMEQSTTGKRVMILYNANGAGTSWSAPQVVGTSGSHWIQAGDIDRDGDIDLYGINHGNNSGDVTVHVWRNKRSESGKRPLNSWRRHVVDPSKPWQAVFIASADLDRDGRKDIVTGGWWYRNPGSAAGSWTRNTIGSPLNNMAAVGDFDVDGDLDVLGTQGTGSNSNHNLAWARNGGSGNFTVLTNIQTGGSGDFLQGVAVERFTPTGPIEAALSWHNGGGGVHMLTVPANPSGTTWSFRALSTTSQDEQLSAGRIDSDGDKDLLLGTKWLRNDGGSWSVQTLFNTSSAPDRNRLADINGDGRLDAVVGYEAISVAGKLAWYEQPATATSAWTEHVISTTVVGPMSVDVADMDSDGDLDVVVGEHNLNSPSTARLLVFENADGKGGTWTSHVVYTGDEHHDGAQVADIDGDGDLDIVSIGWGHSNVVLYENLASGGGTTTPPAAPGGLAASAASSIQINLSWTDHANNETGFKVERAAASGGPWTLIATTGANVASFSNTGLAASTTYWYRVRATNSAGDSAFSNTASATTLTGGGGGVPTSGLQLWLKADAGITLNGSTVSQWADQSGNGRNAAQAAAASQPTLVANALNGKPAAQFDGTNDFMTFTLPVNGLSGMTIALVSACASDRTGGGSNAESAAVFWNETASWGTVYLSPYQTNVKFRFGTTQTGNLPSYTRPASIGSAFSTSISVKNGVTDSLYVNGVQAVSQGGKLSTISACRDTGNLGRGYNDNTYFPGWIAEVLVYSRALSDVERQGLEQYLNGRYFSTANGPPAVSITSPAGGTTFTAPASITIQASASDSDGSVTKVEFFQGATKLGEDTTSPYVYSWSNVPAGSYTLTAKATDDGGGSTMSAGVIVMVNASGGGSVPTSGLALWLKADAGVMLNGSTVSQWADQSGNGRNAAQAAAASQPTFVSSAVNGRPAARFDGTNDFMTFTLPVNGLSGMTIALVSACASDRTGGGSNAESAAVFWNETASWGTVYLSPYQTNVKFRFGTTQTGNLPSYTRPASIGSAFSTSISVKNGVTDSLYVNGVQAVSQGGKLSTISACRDTGNLGRGYNDNTYFPGWIAEVLVYGRALSDVERQGLEQYLSGKYFSSANPLPPAELVKVVSVSTSRPYSLAEAKVGALPYIDRSYAITSLGAGLAGGVLVRTAMDDKYVTAASHLTLSLGGEADVYVGYDKRGTLPGWLAGWTLTSETLVSTDGAASPMRVYLKTVGAGTLTLGGNLASPASGAQANYAVVVQPAGASKALTTATGALYVEGPIPADQWLNDGDGDGDGLLDDFELIYALDPASSDTDGDGVPDESEVLPDGRTLWEVQMAGGGTSGADDGGGGGGCGATGAECLAILAILVLRRR